MKIVKLNRNFNIYKNHGFEVGIKFDMWGREAQRFERVVAERLGHQAWAWKFHPDEQIKENWAAGFGERRESASTPYWIYLRNENLLSLILLAIEAE